MQCENENAPASFKNLEDEMKATIVKVPKKYMVVVDGEIVDFSHSAYQAAEIAKHHGAETLDMKQWTLGTSFSSLISELRSGRSGLSSKQPNQKGKS